MKLMPLLNFALPHPTSVGAETLSKIGKGKFMKPIGK